MASKTTSGALAPAYDAAAMYRARFAQKVEVEGVKIRPGVEVEIRGDLLATVEAAAIASAERI
jgi:DNA-binding protein